MKRISLCLLVLCAAFNGFCQEVRDTVSASTADRLIINVQHVAASANEVITDTFKAHVYPYNNSRIRKVAAANIIGYGGTMAGLYTAWYKNYPQSRFHFFNDNAEWLQMDKMGHVYSAYIESYGSMEMWRWTGISRKDRIWIGGLSGAAYQTLIETLDGFSTKWGWSWGDFASNMVGSGILISQELAWDEQRVRVKFSFHKKKYGSPDLVKRANELYGKNEYERFIKDYNGQTYWFSANLKSFMPKSNLPTWLSVAVGYGAEGMFGGRENINKDDNGIIIFDRSDVKRYRQWFLAPDIDFSRIKTKNKLLKLTFGVLNAFKFPTPSLELSNGKMRVNFIHF